MNNGNEKLIEKCQDVDYTFNLANLAVQRDPNTLDENLIRIKDSILDLVAFYNSYKLRFTGVELAYNKLAKSWDNFVSLIKQYQSKKSLTPEMRMKLSEALQEVKDNNLNLIEVASIQLKK